MVRGLGPGPALPSTYYVALEARSVFSLTKRGNNIRGRASLQGCSKAPLGGWFSQLLLTEHLLHAGTVQLMHFAHGILLTAIWNSCYK